MELADSGKKGCPYKDAAKQLAVGDRLLVRAQA
jgi:hypothetical protein